MKVKRESEVAQVALVVKNPPANAGDIRDMGSIPGSGRSSRGEHNNPLQCFCLENPRDRGAWWAAVYGITQSRTQLKQLSSSSSNMFPPFAVDLDLVSSGDPQASSGSGT